MNIKAWCYFKNALYPFCGIYFPIMMMPPQSLSSFLFSVLILLFFSLLLYLYLCVAQGCSQAAPLFQWLSGALNAKRLMHDIINTFFGLMLYGFVVSTAGGIFIVWLFPKTPDESVTFQALLDVMLLVIRFFWAYAAMSQLFVLYKKLNRNR